MSLYNMINRLDRLISETAYFLDCLRAYRNIVESGCCHDCKYVPKVGELVRYNCPFYKTEGSEA